MPDAKLTASTDALRRHLFYETSHSPSLADLVGYEKASDIIDFCFIANPYYPTSDMLRDLQQNLPNLIKSYPSSNPAMSQKNLSDVLHVTPNCICWTRHRATSSAWPSISRGSASAISRLSS